MSKLIKAKLNLYHELLMVNSTLWTESDLTLGEALSLDQDVQAHLHKAVVARQRREKK